MDFIVTTAINPAKNFFPVHGVVSKGTPAPFCASVPRTELRELIAVLSTFVVDMEACFGEQQLRGRVVKVRSRSAQGPLAALTVGQNPARGGLPGKWRCISQKSQNQIETLQLWVELANQCCTAMRSFAVRSPRATTA